MSLNIKNERVHALARRAARLTGRSQTSVIEEALEQLLARYDDQDPAAADRERRRSRIDAAVERARLTWEAEGRRDFSEADLYDRDSGLPA